MKARELTVKPCPFLEVAGFIDTHHYAGFVNGVRVFQSFAVYHGTNLVGGAIFGGMATTAWKAFGDCENKVIELRRLVLLDEAERNSESRVIGAMLRWLKSNSNIEVVVSYADPLHGHDGTIYRAANFKYLGLSGKDKKLLDRETGKVHHSRSMRATSNGRYKPFALRLREKYAKGELEMIDLPPKHCYIYRFSGRRRKVTSQGTLNLWGDRNNTIIEGRRAYEYKADV